MDKMHYRYSNHLADLEFPHIVTFDLRVSIVERFDTNLILDWLNDNIGNMNSDWFGSSFLKDTLLLCFKNKEDAMAFKLRWS